MLKCHLILYRNFLTFWGTGRENKKIHRLITKLYLKILIINKQVYPIIIASATLGTQSTVAAKII